MRNCECGGTLYRHQKAVWSKSQKCYGERYRCKECRKLITVRNGEIQDSTIGGRFKQDWRYEMGSGNDKRTTAEGGHPA